MRLNATAIKNTKPNGKIQKRSDGGGLVFIVTPTGRKWFHFRYRYNGKPKQLSLGVYPDVTLAQARERREQARKLVAQGIDPSVHRKAQKGQKEASFEAIAREWMAKHTDDWSPSYAKKIIQRLEKNMFPTLGQTPIGELTSVKILEILRVAEARGAKDTAHRLREICGRVFRYAMATGRADANPCDVLRGALSPIKIKHYSAVTEPREAARILRMIDDYQGSIVVRSALRLAPLVFVRPGELRTAEWKDINFETCEWRYLVQKTQTPHLVPLSRQATVILKEIYDFTGSGRYVFPSARSIDRPLSDNALLAAMRSMGISKDEMCTHGFRAMARTMLDEILGFRPDYIEHQLAHAVRDPLGRAYNRTRHLKERKNMMQKWADYIDELKTEEKDFRRGTN